MEEITNITKEDRAKIEKYSRKDIELAYSHNGANIFILNDSSSKQVNKAVCIIKGDNMLSFSMGESYNEFGTAFTRADVYGLPIRASLQESSEKGIYPYSIITKDEQKEDDDIISRAADIYKRENPRVGEIFSSYVPSSLKNICKQIRENQTKQSEAVKTKEMIMQRKIFDSLLERF